MLNDLLAIEEAVGEAGIQTTQRHPDFKEAGRVATVVAELDEAGNISHVRLLPRETIPWTLRDGQHNSFPFLQPKTPLVLYDLSDARLDEIWNKKNPDRRRLFLDMTKEGATNTAAYLGWPGKKFFQRLEDRVIQLEPLRTSDARVVPLTFERFLRACQAESEPSADNFLTQVVAEVLRALSTHPNDEWLEYAIGLLIGQRQGKLTRCTTGLLIEAADCPHTLQHKKVQIAVNSTLQSTIVDRGSQNSTGNCALTGEQVELVEGNFPQPNLPALGQTYLYSKNRDIPSNDRYGRFSIEAMPVGMNTSIKLAAALDALTAEERKWATWRTIPGESPKQNDLLIAFVDGAPDAPIAEHLDEEDFDDDSDVSNAQDTITRFEMRTQRLLDTLQARGLATPETALVRIAIFRKLDPGNRKIAYSRIVTVGQLTTAETEWCSGERNLPEWLSLPVLHKGEKVPRAGTPLHVAPLGLTRFSKSLFIRGGIDRQDVAGVPASEGLQLFLSLPDARPAESQRVRHFMRRTLRNRGVLVANCAHALRRGFAHAKDFDRREVLRTTSVLGVLLHKLDRGREIYMGDTAFKLGQLLAAADQIHAGYCADVRDGSTPPSLLGNQVFTTAQTAPAKALAILCRRWKPYSGWANKIQRDKGKRGTIETLANSQKSEERQRGWDIKKALRLSREVETLATQLAPLLQTNRPDDVFRAELLLGYLAGFPSATMLNKSQDKIEGENE